MRTGQLCLSLIIREVNHRGGFYLWLFSALYTSKIKPLTLEFTLLTFISFLVIDWKWSLVLARHMLMIIDNEEFYEQEKPLSLKDIRCLIVILRQVRFCQRISIFHLVEL